MPILFLGAKDEVLTQSVKAVLADKPERTSVLLTCQLYAKKTDAPWTSVFWRRRRDSNSCYGFPYYSLSRGAP